MNLLTKFNQTFGFTQTESRVVLFLVLTFCAGIGIKLYKSATGTEPRFNYAATDSEFIARSAFLQSDSLTSMIDDSSQLDEQDEIAAARSDQGEKLLPSSRVNLNTASKAELMQLPSVGEVMASRIIDYREKHGAFRRIDDLTKVKGIGDKKFERIAPYCTVGK